MELLALGEPLRLSEMAALSDLDTLQEIEARGMVTIDPGSPDAVLRLAQPLYGEVLRDDLPVLRARALRLTLAETVARRNPLTPDDALRVARWRLGRRAPTSRPSTCWTPRAPPISPAIPSWARSSPSSRPRPGSA